MCESDLLLALCAPMRIEVHLLLSSLSFGLCYILCHDPSVGNVSLWDVIIE